ncbi:MAG: hypothetical protein PHY23_10505 [Oscillospiraceae bacterium]|nr:hypothetical protein [Oscillospiraceae bacterium]
MTSGNARPFNLSLDHESFSARNATAAKPRQNSFVFQAPTFCNRLGKQSGSFITAGGKSDERSMSRKCDIPAHKRDGAFSARSVGVGVACAQADARTTMGMG